MTERLGGTKGGVQSPSTRSGWDAAEARGRPRADQLARQRWDRRTKAARAGPPQRAASCRVEAARMQGGRRGP